MTGPAQRGVTLVELLITVTILAIILSFAVPNFTDRMRKARRTDATTTLLAISGEQEKFFLKNNSFAKSLDDIGIERTNHELYRLSIESDGATYTATATAVGGQANDVECTALTINHLGQRRATGDGGDTSDICWE